MPTTKERVGWNDSVNLERPLFILQLTYHLGQREKFARITAPQFKGTFHQSWFVDVGGHDDILQTVQFIITKCSKVIRKMFNSHCKVNKFIGYKR